MPLPHPKARASTRRILPASSGSPAWPFGGSAQPLRSVRSSESRRPDEGRGSASTWCHDRL
jgi:hypothetical protein